VSKPRTFWIDENLPRRLARALGEKDGAAAAHFRDLSLVEVPDRDIFFRARTVEATIVSKDEDFPLLVAKHGKPPQIVWVRIGNTSTRSLLQTFDMHYDSLQRLLDSGAPVVVIRD
jgi:predicted nuclease of predicted toxin-antitoxin system